MKKLICLLIASCLVLGLLFVAVADVNHGHGPGYKAGYGGGYGHGDDGHGKGSDGHGGDAHGDYGHGDDSHGEDEHGISAANEALRFYIF